MSKEPLPIHSPLTSKPSWGDWFRAESIGSIRHWIQIETPGQSISSRRTGARAARRPRWRRAERPTPRREREKAQPEEAGRDGRTVKAIEQAARRGGHPSCRVEGRARERPDVRDVGGPRGRRRGGWTPKNVPALVIARAQACFAAAQLEPSSLFRSAASVLRTTSTAREEESLDHRAEAASGGRVWQRAGTREVARRDAE